MAWRWWGVYCIAVLFLAHVPARPAAGATPLSNAGPVLDEMAKQLENRSLSVSERVQIVKTLGEWQTAQVRPPLVAALKDPTPEIREAASDGVSQLVVTDGADERGVSAERGGSGDRGGSRAAALDRERVDPVLAVPLGIARQDAEVIEVCEPDRDDPHESRWY